MSMEKFLLNKPKTLLYAPMFYIADVCGGKYEPDYLYGNSFRVGPDGVEKGEPAKKSCCIPLWLSYTQEQIEESISAAKKSGANSMLLSIKYNHSSRADILICDNKLLIDEKINKPNIKNFNFFI